MLVSVFPFVRTGLLYT